LANAEDRLNDYSSALKEIERATELLQELETTLSDDEPPRGNFSYCYNLMANFMLRHKRYEEALSYLEKCIQIDARSSPFMHPVTVLEHDTVNSSMLYSIYRALGQTEKATQYLQKSYSSAKAYHEKSNALKTEELYAATTARLGIAAMWDDEFEKANSLLKEAYQRLERIAKLTLSTFAISWQDSILENYHNLFTKQGKINLAEPLYQKQIALYENAVKELKNINLTLSLARSYYSYAKAIGIPSRKKDCAILYQKATSTFFSAYKKTYNQTTLQKAMISCRDFIELAIELQDEELIFQGYQKLIDCYCETREKSPSDYAKIINAASYLAPKANERLAVKYNLLISCYATELLLSEPNDEELIQQKRYAEEKLREFDARHGISDYAVDTYDNYFEYFLDRKEPTAKRLAATLLTFIGDNRIDEYQISNYYAADRQYATLLKDFPNDEFLIKQREILAEKIQRAREMEEEREKDPFEGIDIKALIDEVYGSDENE
jgi:tetratricopeptide (TPR) repeat protein